MKDKPIGFFDSGVGGVSVLAEALRVLPAEDFVYYGDTAHVPYGNRSEAEILELTLVGVNWLLDRGCKALIIACNTATSAAANTLRARFPLSIIGMEPALKPAAALRKKGRVLVLATQATLRQTKYQDLLQRYGEGVVSIPCPKLVQHVERGEFRGPAVEETVRGYIGEYLEGETEEATADCIVLGCTHYFFVRDAIRAVADVPIIDGNRGTVLQLKRELERQGIARTEGKGSVAYYASGPDDVLRLLLDTIVEGANRIS